MDRPLLPRVATSDLQDHLGIMPAVVLTGARQTGKTTLARSLLTGARRYQTLDDLDVRALAVDDPRGLVEGAQALTLDEVQRHPDLLLSIKAEIDRQRAPGRFLLTGSASLLLAPAVSESLAGRASHLVLWPLTRREQAGAGEHGRWEELCSTAPDAWEDLLREGLEERADWRRLARRGGFPVPALHLRTAKERRIWFTGYVRTYLERDLQDLSSVSSLTDFRRFMQAAALRLGTTLNQSDLGRDVGISQPTAHRWTGLLEASHLLVPLPAWSVNRTKRLVKAPKVYWADTGLAMHLAGLETPTGACLENLILHDLLVWQASSAHDIQLHHWRTQSGAEVDLIVERGSQVLPVEVKSTGRPRVRDIRHLRTFRSEVPDRCLPGLLLHGGETLEWLTPEVLAAPWWCVC